MSFFSPPLFPALSPVLVFPQPFLRSEAHVPHDEKYAEAFWPAALAAACAWLRSGARERREVLSKRAVAEVGVGWAEEEAEVDGAEPISKLDGEGRADVDVDFERGADEAGGESGLDWR